MGAAAPPAGKEHTTSPGPGRRTVLLQVAGAGLLIAAAAIHLDLYLTGYRTIPTIGWLFLLQVIAAFALGLAVLAVPRRLALAGRLAAAAGAGFALATLGGYLLSVWTGLFGFKEVRTTAGIAAGVIEVAAFAVLALLALAPAVGRPASRALIPAAFTRTAAVTAGALTIAALVLLGVAVAGANPAPPAVTGTGTGTGTGLKTTTIGGTTVLTNSKGFTLYSFAPDTPTTSKCNGTCATNWPPVKGPVTGAGVTGTFSTIKRADGSTQATFDSHPLYTFVGDTAPGQNKGNGLNAAGGLWHEITTSGTSAPAGGSSSGSGGSGY